MKTRNDIVINTLSDAKKYTIFANNKSATHTMLINNGFEKIVSGWHQKISVEMLLRGRIDLLVLTEKNLEPTFKELNVSTDLVEKTLLIERSEGFMAFSKQTSDAIVNKAITAYNELLEEKKIPAY